MELTYLILLLSAGFSSYSFQNYSVIVYLFVLKCKYRHNLPIVNMFLYFYLYYFLNVKYL